MEILVRVPCRFRAELKCVNKFLRSIMDKPGFEREIVDKINKSVDKDSSLGAPGLRLGRQKRNPPIALHFGHGRGEEDEHTVKTSTVFDLVFNGAVAERINGRLAMIGFVAAMAVEFRDENYKADACALKRAAQLYPDKGLDLVILETDSNELL
ncbi:hypothetical protein CCACVL1_27668 [Corchorus capsularis]|uniref:Uncharacterized protein n=1 Tax=Corchorus capsularis TaxID=210143 RepID=A0A1R3G9F2_COCAP|nr:hypothetical protein CCACVL1_27668 [Corchorus capsularis]